MPITGEVLVLNEELENAPELVNSDPYGEGWMIKVAASDPKELEGLLTANEYKQLIA